MSEHATNAGAHAAHTAGTDEQDRRERPIGELVKELSQQTSTLVRKEIELARAAVAGLLMLVALTATLIALLDEAMATWIAALIVTALWAIIALVLAKTGQKALQNATPPAPQTVETV